MKGVLRKVDGLGRVSIPIEFRRMQGIENEEKVEIINTEDGILVKRANYKPKPLAVAIQVLEKEIKHTSDKKLKEELERIKNDIKKLGA